MGLTEQEERDMYRAVIETGVVIKTLSGRLQAVEKTVTDISIHGCEKGRINEKRINSIKNKPILSGGMAGAGMGTAAGAFVFGILKYLASKFGGGELQ